MKSRPCSTCKNKGAGIYNVPIRQLVAPDVVVQSLSPASVTLSIERIRSARLRRRNALRGNRTRRFGRQEQSGDEAGGRHGERALEPALTSGGRSRERGDAGRPEDAGCDDPAGCDQLALGAECRLRSRSGPRSRANAVRHRHGSEDPGGEATFWDRRRSRRSQCRINAGVGVCPRSRRCHRVARGTPRAIFERRSSSVATRVFPERCSRRPSSPALRRSAATCNARHRADACGRLRDAVAEEAAAGCPRSAHHSHNPVADNGIKFFSA